MAMGTPTAVPGLHSWHQAGLMPTQAAQAQELSGNPLGAGGGLGPVAAHTHSHSHSQLDHRTALAGQAAARVEQSHRSSLLTERRISRSTVTDGAGGRHAGPLYLVAMQQSQPQRQPQGQPQDAAEHPGGSLAPIIMQYLQAQAHGMEAHEGALPAHGQPWDQAQEGHFPGGSGGAAFPHAGGVLPSTMQQREDQRPATSPHAGGQLQQSRVQWGDDAWSATALMPPPPSRSPRRRPQSAPQPARAPTAANALPTSGVQAWQCPADAMAPASVMATTGMLGMSTLAALHSPAEVPAAPTEGHRQQV